MSSVLLAVLALASQQMGFEIGVTLASILGIVATLIGFTLAALISIQALAEFIQVGRRRSTNEKDDQ